MSATMTWNDKTQVMPKIVEVLARFKAQGAEEVFVSTCCGRTYIGIDPAQGCRTCGESQDVERVPLNG